MKQYKNILIVRTDRIGDLVLTTPVILALRQAYPDSNISIMVNPQAKPIVEGNPYLDEVIVFDRKKTHKGFWPLLKFIGHLRKKDFDLVLVLHTKKITNLICFLAGIPQRVGYKNEKFGFFLNQGIKDTRAQGRQHEVQYCLDVLRHLGIPVGNPQMYIPLSAESKPWMENFMMENCITESTPLIAVHPDASCISKRWPAQNFAELINMINRHYSTKIVLIGNSGTRKIISQIIPLLEKSVIDLSAETTLHQLIRLLRQCQVLISNDSGPVHLAGALGIPVIAIFGRNQLGLSPTRWKPLSERSIVLHKEVGCTVCLAHNCQIDFKCLQAIKPQEVFEALTQYLDYVKMNPHFA